jgi:hypothetical protein
VNGRSRRFLVLISHLHGDHLHLRATPDSSGYLGGEIDLFPDIAEPAPVDIALLPAWGWGPNLGPGHLDPVRGARTRRLLIDPPLEFAAGVPAAGHDTAVVVARPGEGIPFPAAMVRP